MSFIFSSSRDSKRDETDKCLRILHLSDTGRDSYLASPLMQSLAESKVSSWPERRTVYLPFSKVLTVGPDWNIVASYKLRY
jgi:hypothetical protein